MKKENGQILIAVHCQSLLLFHIIYVARVESKTQDSTEIFTGFYSFFFFFLLREKLLVVEGINGSCSCCILKIKSLAFFPACNIVRRISMKITQMYRAQRQLRMLQYKMLQHTFLGNFRAI